MLDYSHIEQYRENNRIEAKKAAGGLPRSIWETYSAFANTIGGVILLGVEELPNHALRPIHLENAEQLVDQFRTLLHTPGKVSVNILTKQDVTIHEQAGARFISITVPRAPRCLKPVYVDGDPLRGTYRRNGEGDYHCSPEAVQAMLRDAAEATQDMAVLDAVSLSALDPDTLRRYRSRLAAAQPEHPLAALADADLLYRLGAAGNGTDGVLHPTAGGLLFFGREDDIRQQFPSFRLEDKLDADGGLWHGNLHDFYFHGCARLKQALPRLSTGADAVHAALCEALANCLINADYCGSGGVVLLRGTDSITLSNPGSFRIPPEDARSGGQSDPRNAALMRLFHLIRVGSRTGSGIPGIFRVWRRQGWAEPSFTEELCTERITLTLPLCPPGAPSAKPGKPAALPRAIILQYLTEHITATTAELAEILSLSIPQVRRLLARLRAEGYVVVEGSRRYRTYRLKA